jgi:hypothetical protein
MRCDCDAMMCLLFILKKEEIVFICVKLTQARLIFKSKDDRRINSMFANANTRIYVFSFIFPSREVIRHTQIDFLAIFAHALMASWFLNVMQIHIMNSSKYLYMFNFINWNSYDFSIRFLVQNFPRIIYAWLARL